MNILHNVTGAWWKASERDRWPDYAMFFIRREGQAHFGAEYSVERAQLRPCGSGYYHMLDNRFLSPRGGP
jgi:hypothetical protein